MTRRARIIVIAVSIPAVLIIAAAIAVYVMLQPQRFTATLRGAASRAGLELSLATPARPSLWPRPNVVLQGVELTPQGSQSPLLLATEVRLMVPWRDILGGHTAISQLEVDAPRIDTDALHSLLSRLPSGSGGAPSLPRVDAGIVVNGGSLVRGDSVVARDISLHIGRLQPDHPFELSGSARTADGTAYSLTLDATPHQGDTALTFDPLRLHVHDDQGLQLSLAGNARWAGGSQFQANLKGNAKTGKNQSYALDLDTVPPQAKQPMLLHLRVQGPAVQADLELPPAGLPRWWNSVTGSSSAPLTAPPVTGTLQADQLSFGKMQVKGLSVQAGADVPAPASTAAATGSKGTGRK